MNIIKYLLIALIIVLPAINFAQNSSEFDCESEFETIKTEIESQEIVSYKIVYSRKVYTDESFEFSEGIIVISDLNDKISTDEIIKTIVGIGVTNKLSKILAFKTCEAKEIYFQKAKLTPEQAEYLEKNLLPNVEIDLNKSLSKKDRKKNKRKRDLIEMVSNKSCEEFKQFNTEEISAEQFSQVLSNIAAEYVEKTMNVYEMPFEESAIQFIDDLTKHLFINCESMKELTQE